MLAALALGTTLGSLAIPAPGHTVATQTLVSWLVRVVIVLIAAGVLGGVFVRADGRYRELAMGAFALGWIIVFLMFGFWATMHTAPSDCTAANPCDTPAETFGTGVIALLAAVILVLSALAGRCGRRLVVPKLPKPT